MKNLNPCLVRMFFVTGAGSALFFGEPITLQVALNTMHVMGGQRCRPFKVIGFAAAGLGTVPYTARLSPLADYAPDGIGGRDEDA